LIAGAAIALLAFVGMGCDADSANTLPTFATARAAYAPSDHLLLDRRALPLHERRVDFDGRRLRWTALAEVSPALVDAVIAAEDKRFFAHGGVDGLAVLAAAVEGVRGGSRRGASTITMQLASLTDAAPRPARRTLRDKWRQMRRAWAIESAWSKDEIVEAYLNLVTFRGELQGIGAAAELLFGVAPHALTQSQSIVLAASLRAPNAATDTLVRRATVLAARRGRADDERITRDAARVVRIPLASPPRASLAPHLAAQLLTATRAAVVTTTLDARLQRVAIASLRSHLLGLRDQRVDDGAVLVADNLSGEVLAYVGSSGSLSQARFVDGVRAKRQAGSTLKPFLYALAIDERRLTAASPLRDSPLEIFLTTGSYRPTNYDHEFRGAISLRTALGSSLNVPAVRTLELIGGAAFLDRLRRAGFTTLDRPAEHYGPGLALGSGEVTLWDLVNAYRMLANRGVTTPLRLLPVGAHDPPDRPTTVFGDEATFVIADILADRDARAATFGRQSALDSTSWAAVKTGTSTDMRDNWCIGFSNRYTVGVWVGNFSGAPMGDVSGVSGAAPVWSEILHWLHRHEPSTAPAPPAGVVPVALEDGRREWFLRGTEPVGGRIVAAPPRPRIAAPIAGAILALDPEMPAAVQRVALESRPRDPAWSWWLGDERLGDAAAPLLWPPRPGLHRLELRNAAGDTVDAIQFRVRASHALPQPPAAP